MTKTLNILLNFLKIEDQKSIAQNSLNISPESTIILYLGDLWCNVTHGGTDLQPDNQVALPLPGNSTKTNFSIFSGLMIMH